MEAASVPKVQVSETSENTNDLDDEEQAEETEEYEEEAEEVKPIPKIRPIQPIIQKFCKCGIICGDLIVNSRYCGHSEINSGINQTRDIMFENIFSG